MQHLQQFEALFNYATIGIILCNNKAEIINFNKQAETQFGYAKEEVLGKKIEILIPTKYRETHVADRDRFYAHPQNRVMGAGRDLFGQKKDGTEFPVEISLSNYRLEGETYAIAFVIDITIRKQGELIVHQQKAELEQITSQIRQLNSDLEQKVENRTKMLRETLAELERSRNELSDALAKEKELGELKTGFVTMASHEFRTPLSTILSSAFLLSKYDGPDDGPKRGKHIQRIAEAVNGMKSILEDFLSLGRLEDGSVQAKLQPIPVAEFIEEIGGTIEGLQQIAKKGQQVRFTHTGGERLMVDVALLRNILTNLISNAIKFSPEHSEIRIASELNDTGLSISVSDQGIGISREDQEHLFERFFRARNAANIQGTGLGLHIVAKYLQLLNGSISMQSELDKGTSFTIHIPQTETDEKNTADRR